MKLRRVINQVPSQQIVEIKHYLNHNTITRGFAYEISLELDHDCDLAHNEVYGLMADKNTLIIETMPE